MSLTDIESGISTPAAATYAENRSSLYHSPRRQFGNATPLGLFAFASSVLIGSLYNLRVKGVMHGNAMIGHSLFCGGLAQILAGMWQFACGNTPGGTIATLYGTYNMSYAYIFIPSSGILAAYTDPSEFGAAVGTFVLAWALIAFFLLIGQLRTNFCTVFMGSVNVMSFSFLSASYFHPERTGLLRTSGSLGLIVAFFAFYIGLSELLRADKTHFIRLPLGVFGGKRASKTS
ncbi:hypothetical protein HGRIS_014461 [Hohenbuehelia grisea]|uniref:Uncharacterized protein n=1 Tax=Hohenbuehelia grisea TaxID=104357 RepID=A0ABR3JTI0_9AGAR